MPAKQYTPKSYLALKKRLFKVLNDYQDVEFDIIKNCIDCLGNKYLYIHLKDYSDGSRWVTAKKSVKFILHKFNYSQINCSDRKVLFWVPELKGVKFLSEDGEKYKITHRVKNEKRIFCNCG